MLKSLSDFIATTTIDSIVIEPLNIAVNTKPEDIFKNYSNQPWAIWLDSCQTNHIDSNFDIMVWQPIYTIETVANTSTVTNQLTQVQLSLKNDPLALVKQINQQLFKSTNLNKDNSSSLPFLGGAVGLFGYDLGRQFENLPKKAIKDISLADMAIGFYDKAIIFNRLTKKYYLICQASQLAALKQQINDLLHNDVFLNDVSRSEVLINNIKPNKTITNQDAKFSLMSDWLSNINKQQYQDKFSQVQAYLLAGDCYQINLAQRFEATYQGDEFQAYLTLREHNKAPFSAFIRLKENAILSLSPERFLKLANGKVQTKPIKGTRPRFTNKEKDLASKESLLAATKDRAENLMIVDLLRNDISRTCIAGSVKVPKLFAIESFPAVHHLVSTIEGDLNAKFQATDLLRGAFPGGSITGAPKIRAMEIIEQLEPHRRNLYCGSVGYISACGNMDTSITIRTLICENNKIYCWAGGGLVADSTVENEYQETFDKVKKILPILKNNI